MAESKKRYPNIEFYTAVHNFFNQKAKEEPGKRFKFRQVLQDLHFYIEEGYRNKNGIKVPYTTVTPTPSVSSMNPMGIEAMRNRFDDLTKDISERLKEHGIAWSFKIGEKASATYAYQENVPYNLPEECEKDKIKHDINLLREVVGYTQTPFSNKGIKRDIISFSTNSLLNNIGYVKELFRAIRYEKMVEFTYNAAYSNHPKHHVLSPHYLKEYNMRWYLFGYTEDVTDPDDESVNADSHPREGYYTFAIDRIDDEGIVVLSSNDAKYKYHTPQLITDYSTWFDDIVGVTHQGNGELVDVDIITFDGYTHNRIMSKPIHKSQVEVEPFTSKEEPGHIKLHLCMNQELQSQLLSFGDSIAARWKGKSYDDFLRRIDRMFRRYTTNFYNQ